MTRGWRSHAYRCGQWLCEWLPVPAAYRLAEAAADAWWWWARTPRAGAAHNLSAVAGRQVTAESASTREVFRNFARYLAEFFLSHRLTGAAVAVDGRHHLAAAERAGRGVIVLTAHLGNWEVGAVALRQLGFRVRAVALPHPDARMDRLFNRQRERCGIGVIPLGAGASRRSIDALRDGQLLGVLGDREFGSHGLRVGFCGGVLTVPQGPAVISLRTRAPIVPTVLVREGAWKFRLSFEPPLWPPSGSAPADAIRTLIEGYAAAVERAVKRWPEQWLMFDRVVEPGKAGTAGPDSRPAGLARAGRG